MTIRDVMTAKPKTVPGSATLRDVARLMRDEDTGAVPVVDNDRPLGIITDRDIVIRAVAENATGERAVREFVSGDPVTIDAGASTRDALELMASRQIRRLLVVDADRLVGIVSLGDLAVKEGKDKRLGETLEEISQPA